MTVRGWAKRKRATILIASHMVGTAQTRLCPPYGLEFQTATAVIARSDSDEAIQLQCSKKKAGLLRFARNDVGTQFRDLAAHICSRLAKNLPPSKQRARGIPGAQCTRSLVCKRKHTS